MATRAMVAAGWPSVGEALAEGSEGESTSWELIGWGDRRYGLSAAKSIYHSANAMALLGLGFASLLAVCLFHAVATCHGPRARFHRQYTHCKSLITCFSPTPASFFIAIISICVPKFTCDLFFGTASQTHHSPEDSIEVVWSPFVGWVMALLSTPLAVLIFLTSCFVKKPPPPPARSYRLVIN
ncbi:uncharacterized protein ACA1_100630 [Acanthamoeba castellanii str. Neff]|uniref:Transmembrane protein n=1 Tax=Acanthamoeba castellanii (strain ATCC 30010 / Neff) TaxID=1257118 RepID=L8GLY9_ACACF|nr:uncharacterized protein ACA1_100630 [Acanthamoeba castellanii str. Neff]ELR13226.1 hypothetical protein ACA1_100630 [Acanthamoeba castellanii str. Neff]